LQKTLIEQQIASGRNKRRRELIIIALTQDMRACNLQQLCFEIASANPESRYAIMMSFTLLDFVTEHKRERERGSLKPKDLAQDISHELPPILIVG
jgi:hypothetical protein